MALGAVAMPGRLHFGEQSTVLNSCCCYSKICPIQSNHHDPPVSALGGYTLQGTGGQGVIETKLTRQTFA